ncbi:MAG: T9SS type A sorting domain-containing protein [Flavobacteriales bacterium]|nr:T9SS type A sorting domain-containing protein [Flavobacteriales bacterium]
MKTLFTALAFASSVGLSAQFAYHHAFTLGSTAFDQPPDIDLDADGNVYVVGGVNAALDVDPGPDEMIMIPNGYDLFMAKYSPEGELIWAHTVGSAANEFGGAVKIAGSALYVCGTFDGPDADLDPGVAVVSPDHVGGQDAFVARYDLDGHLAWVIGIGGSDEDGLADIGMTSTGDVVVCGSFESTDLDAAPGAETVLLSTAGETDVLFARYSAAGALVYAHSFGGGGTLGADRVLRLQVDANDNLYLTGSFSSTGGDFDPGEGEVILNSVGSGDIFLSKFDPTGTLDWVVSFGGTTGDQGYGLANDGADNIYLCGYSNSATIDLDPGPDVEEFSSGAVQDIVVVKLSPEAEYLWAFRLGAGSSDIGNALCIDEADNVFLMGSFGDVDVDFDPGPADFPLNSNSGTDMFLAHYHADGTLVDAFAVGGAGMDSGTNGVLTPDGRVWMSGWKSGVVDADPGPNVAELEALGSADMFIGCYAYGIGAGLNEARYGSFALFPNPASTSVTVQCAHKEPAICSLIDVTGRILAQQRISAFPAYVDLQGLPAGHYTARLQWPDGSLTRQLVKVE